MLLDFVDLPEDDPAPRAPVLRAPGLPQRPPAGDRGPRAPGLLLQLAVRRLPGVHRPRHQEGGRPGADRPRRGAHACARARSSRGPAAHTLEYFLRLLEALGRGREVQHRHPVAAAAGPGAEDDPARLARTRSTSATATSTAASAPTTPASRAWCSGSSGGTPTPRATGRATSTRATCATCPCPACGGARLKPEVLAVTIAGKSIAEVCDLSVGECAELLGHDGAHRPAEDDRRAGAQGDQRPAAVPGRRRPGLPVAGPRRRHPVRRRGAAHPAGHPDRLRPGRRALRAGRAVDRPAPARQPPADRDAGPAEEPGQHADRGRARRGHHPHRRLDRRHRPGRRRARRPDRAQRLGARACWPTRSR